MTYCFSLLSRINNLEALLANLNFKCNEDKKRIEFENSELKQQTRFSENELSQTMCVVKNLKERNEMLENKVENLTK